MDHISIKRSFPALPEVVWDYWTRPKLMSLWFGSDPNGSVVYAENDLRVGGQFSVTFQNADKTEYSCQGEYLLIEPCGRLETTWWWKGHEHHIERVYISLSAQENKCILDFEHRNIDPQSIHGYFEGWMSTFDKLERVMANGENLELKAKVDGYIAGFSDWRGRVMGEIRGLIRKFCPEAAEDWKWEVPVWTFNGNVFAVAAFKENVKINFFKGASLADPKKLFNAGLEAKATRAIDIAEGSMPDPDALGELFRQAVLLNQKPKKAK